jgi:hypothetical protein
MKYYSLKFKRDLGGWGGKAKMWKIQILEKYRHDKGLLEHEKFHVRCWWYCLAAAWAIAAGMYFAGPHGWWLPVALLGPLTHGTLYRNKYFRKLVEVKAYKIQLKVGGYGSPDFAVNALANKYKLGISEKEASKLLGL